MMQLSEHFSLAELIASDYAVRKPLDNTPPLGVVANLTRLAAALEIVRKVLGHPIYISSGYRSPRLNKAIGGAKASAHLDGRAADFTCPGFGSPRAVCQELIVAAVRFDQLIYEGSWVHFAIPQEAEGWRREILTARFTPQGVRYEKGIV